MFVVSLYLAELQRKRVVEPWMLYRLGCEVPYQRFRGVDCSLLQNSSLLMGDRQ
jgi:hypothetical protein